MNFESFDRTMTQPVPEVGDNAVSLITRESAPADHRVKKSHDTQLILSMGSLVMMAVSIWIMAILAGV